MKLWRETSKFWASPPFGLPTFRPSSLRSHPSGPHNTHQKQKLDWRQLDCQNWMAKTGVGLFRRGGGRRSKVEMGAAYSTFPSTNPQGHGSYIDDPCCNYGKSTQRRWKRLKNIVSNLTVVTLVNLAVGLAKVRLDKLGIGRTLFWPNCLANDGLALAKLVAVVRV